MFWFEVARRAREVDGCNGVCGEVGEALDEAFNGGSGGEVFSHGIKLEVERTLIDLCIMAFKILCNIKVPVLIPCPAMDTVGWERYDDAFKRQSGT